MLKYRLVGLDGKVAVVTGAGRGLGRAHALALAQAGAAVLVNDLDGDAARSVVAEIEGGGGRAAVDERALGSVADGRAVVEAAVERLDGIDIVINNAGASAPVPVDDLDDEGVDLHLGVHLRATVGTTAAAIPHFRARGWGRIVNTVSGHGLEPQNPRSAAYAAAKAGVFGFTRAAALEAPAGVTVNAVAPLAYTRMSEAYLSSVEGAEERFAPEHVSDIVVWLCADDVAEVNGRVFRVEGKRVGEYRVSASALVAFERVWDLIR